MQQDEEIKVVKIEEEQQKEEIVEENNKKKKKTKEKKEKKKMGKLELIFDIISVIFLVGFSCFYGYRLLHYKKVFTPKTSTGQTITLLSNTLKSTSVTEGEGLYYENRNFIFKGENVNNYVLYSNMLWRITKLNADGSIEIVLDDYLNYLAFDKQELNFEKSDLNKYLNTVFIKNLNTDILINSIYCNDTVKDLNNVTCNSKNSENYVKLLSISDYLSSKKDEKSYLNGEVWLYNNDGKEVWLMNNSNLSLVEPNELYQVKPVVVLTNTVGLYSGNGTKENPYKVEEKSNYFASYVKLGEDLYQVYEVSQNNLKLVMDGLYRNGNTKYQFSSSENTFNIEEVGLGKFLNTTFLENITYSDLLVECEWNIGKYDRLYENVSKEKIKSKVGLLNITDPLFNKESSNYYLSTPFEESYTYIFNGDTITAVKPTAVRNVRPTVCIDKNSIKSGEGTKENPYILVEESIEETPSTEENEEVTE